MTRRLAALVAWLGAGHALLAAVFWAFLHVPESNAVMLALSAGIVLLLTVLAAQVEGTAAAWLRPGTPFRAAVRAGWSALPGLLVAVLVFAACWWAGSRVDAWHEAHAGEIDAWVIARGWRPRTAWIHDVIDVVVFLLRVVVALALGSAALQAWVHGGAAGLVRVGWAGRALSPRALALTAMSVILFIVLPWRLVYWRPEWLPPTWVEMLFAGVKLACLFVLAQVGWLGVLMAGAHRRAAVRL